MECVPTWKVWLEFASAFLQLLLVIVGIVYTRETFLLRKQDRQKMDQAERELIRQRKVSGPNVLVRPNATIFVEGIEKHGCFHVTVQNTSKEKGAYHVRCMLSMGTSVKKRYSA